MVDGILVTCVRCGADVPMNRIRSVYSDGRTVHAVWQCSCGHGECQHMTPRDFRAVSDSVGVEAGREPMGFLTSDERTLLAFREALDAVASPADLEAAWK